VALAMRFVTLELGQDRRVSHAVLDAGRFGGWPRCRGGELKKRGGRRKRASPR
jgi:hypothetical protein